jgi:hypothetical protein
MAASVWAGAMAVEFGAPRADLAFKPLCGVKHNINICVGATTCIFDFMFPFAALCEKNGLLYGEIRAFRYIYGRTTVLL